MLWGRLPFFARVPLEQVFWQLQWDRSWIALYLATGRAGSLEHRHGTVRRLLHLPAPDAQVGLLLLGVAPSPGAGSAGHRPSHRDRPLHFVTEGSLPVQERSRLGSRQSNPSSCRAVRTSSPHSSYLAFLLPSPPPQKPNSPLSISRVGRLRPHHYAADAQDRFAIAAYDHNQDHLRW